MTNKISVIIEGTTPILFNRFRDVAIEGKSKKRTGAMAEADIEDKLYLDDDGKVQLPSVYLKNCIVEASKQFKIVGKGKSTYSKLVASTIDISPFYIKLEAGKYEVFRISAVNPMTKGRMMTERPRFNKWSAVESARSAAESASWSATVKKQEKELKRLIKEYVK